MCAITSAHLPLRTYLRAPTSAHLPPRTYLRAPAPLSLVLCLLFLSTIAIVITSDTSMALVDVIVIDDVLSLWLLATPLLSSSSTLFGYRASTWTTGNYCSELSLKKSSGHMQKKYSRKQIVLYNQHKTPTETLL